MAATPDEETGTPHKPMIVIQFYGILNALPYGKAAYFVTVISADADLVVSAVLVATR